MRTRTKARAKATFKGPLFLAALLLAAAPCARAQTEQRVVVKIEPSQTVEERVSDELTAKELKKAAEERAAAEESARAAELNPKALLARARTVYVTSGTSFFEPAQLQNALRKRTETEAWRLAILDGDWERRKVADLLIHIDRPLFTYSFTYQVTDRSTGVVVAVGKVTAFDGNAAAPKLARRIVEEIKVARGEAKPKK